MSIFFRFVCYSNHVFRHFKWNMWFSEQLSSVISFSLSNASMQIAHDSVSRALVSYFILRSSSTVDNVFMKLRRRYSFSTFFSVGNTGAWLTWGWHLHIRSSKYAAPISRKGIARYPKTTTIIMLILKVLVPQLSDKLCSCIVVVTVRIGSIIRSSPQNTSVPRMNT